MKTRILLTVVMLATILSGCRKNALSPLPATTCFTTTPTETAETTVHPTSEPTTDSILLAVLADTQPVLTEFGILQSLGEYLQENYSASAVAFTLLDMNRDGANELVVETNSEVSTYVVVHWEQDTAYAFSFGIRQLGGLKSDGSFRGSSSAFNTLFMTMDFADGSYSINTLAECEYYEDWFTVGGEFSTQEEFEQFAANWEQRPSPSWIYLSESEPTASSTEPSAIAAVPYLETIPRAEQPIFRDPTYDAPYMGVVQLAGVYTIVEECYDAEGNLWGKLKSGAGWVDLTQIRNPSCPLNVGFAEDALLENGNHYFALDTAEYPVSLVIRPDETIRNFQLTEVDLSTGEAVLTETIFTLEELTNDIPLVAQLQFPGDMSCFGILFTDASGTQHRYLLSMSMRNGMPHIYAIDN